MKSDSVFVLLFVMLIIGLVSLVGIETIDAGQIGVQTKFGKIVKNSVEPGIHWVNPIGGDIVRYNVREQSVEIVTPTYTRDMQQAKINVLATYCLNKADVGIVHQTFGRNYADKVVFPKIIGAVKDVIGNVEATELINSREKTAKQILESVMAQINLSNIPVTITSLVMQNIDYSDVFEKSIEEKVIAQQNAIRAQNETKRIEEESRQTVIRAEAEAKTKLVIAEAEAKAIEIRGKALKENPDVVMLNGIEKWDGKMPNTLFVGSSIPNVFDVSKLIK